MDTEKLIRSVELAVARRNVPSGMDSVDGTPYDLQLAILAVLIDIRDALRPTKSSGIALSESDRAAIAHADIPKWPDGRYK